MISICLPTHNRVSYIDESLYRAIHQTYDDYEIIVGDSSHHNQIKERIERLNCKRVRYLRFPTNMNMPAKFNELIKAAQGDWVVFIGDDDLVESNYLKKMSAHTLGNENIHLVRCRFKLIDKNGGLLRLDPESKLFMSPFEFLTNLFLPEQKFFKMNIAGLLFRRKTLIDCGGFVEMSVPWHFDLIAWAMLGSKGGCLYEKSVLCNIRIHPKSLTFTSEDGVDAAIETNCKSRLVLSGILDELVSHVRTDEDQYFLNEARRNMDTYMKRHLSRCLDQGFISVLGKNGNKDSDSDLKKLFGMMKELNVSEFSSFLIYRYLHKLPHLLRQPFIYAFKEYKLNKWCS